MALDILAEYFPLLMFPVLFIGILSGFPVAFVLAGVGLLFGLMGHYWFDIFYLSDFGFISAKIFGVISNVTLIAVPLFIFMGITLEKSGIAEELLETADHLLRRVRGGLIYGLVLVGALLAASTGIVGATVVTMAALSLPSLIKRSYDEKISVGTICAAGTLGQIIPPSIVLILLADMMNIAVADLFAGAVIPGLLLVLTYLGYLIIRISINPELVPHLEIAAVDSLPRNDDTANASFYMILSALLPPVLLITLVLGSILFGIASPTESAACGAFGALVIGLLKKRLTIQKLQEILESSTKLTSMVFALLFGAQVFSVVFRGMYGDDILLELLSAWEENSTFLLFIVMLFFFVLGFFLDFLEICFIFVPVVTPILIEQGNYPPLWIAVLIALNLQTSFLTPPFGFSLFYLRGVAPDSIKTIDIYRGVAPFVLIQLVILGLVFLFPELVLWLPKKLWG